MGIEVVRGKLAIASVAACLLVSGPAGVAQDRIDALMAEQMQARGIPGLSLAVVREGAPVKVKGYGRASLEFDAPVTPETIFQLYSVTKIFAGIAAMALVDDRALTLDAPVTTLVREAPAAWSGITVRHLLTHTSGLPELADNPRYAAMPQEARDALTSLDMLKIAAEAPLRSVPGDRWSYHRFGYTLLGLAVERVSGQTFDAFLQSRIYARTGMSSTQFGDVLFVVPGRATSYNMSAAGMRQSHYRFGYGNPGAGLNSSAADLGKLMASLHGDTLLSGAGREAMWTQARLNDGSMKNYGLGWTVDVDGTRTVVGHEGGGAAWVSHYPADRLSVVILHNLNGSGRCTTSR
jgi:D-alanyl-D-alanine carboxypeptidase